MSVAQWLLLLAAGIGGGLTGSIAGLASLVTYPALLATGLAPVVANVTNTVALVFNGVGALSASRVELSGQSVRIKNLLAVGVLGGLTGALLLLVTPSEAFEKIVPFLIGAAGVAILIERKPRPTPVRAPDDTAPNRLHPGLLLGTFAIGIYGGYFGAAAGVLMLAMFLLVMGDTVPRSNALKTLVLGGANAVAAIGFILLADVAWTAALPLAIGLFIGGRLGPPIVRRVDGRIIRRVIAVLGLGLAVKLGLDAF